MSFDNSPPVSAFARRNGLDSVNVETLEIIESTLSDEGRYSRTLEDLCQFLVNLHREAVTKPLSRDERKRHLLLVNAKLAQINDRIKLVC